MAKRAGKGSGNYASGHRSIAKNRRARYQYEILDELECGIALQGTEVKGLREGQCSIAEAYCRVRDAELWLIGMHIPEYSCASSQNHSPTRERRLLAHAQQIRVRDAVEVGDRGGAGVEAHGDRAQGVARLHRVFAAGRANWITGGPLLGRDRLLHL